MVAAVATCGEIVVYHRRIEIFKFHFNSNEREDRKKKKRIEENMKNG